MHAEKCLTTPMVSWQALEPIKDEVLNLSDLREQRRITQ